MSDCCCYIPWEYRFAESIDGDLPYCGRRSVGPTVNKLMLQSGFSSTVVTSLAVTSAPEGISWDGTDTLWNRFNRLYLQSGQFSSTIKNSQATVVSGVADISWDGTNTLFCDDGFNDTDGFFVRPWLMSGKFSSTILDSLRVIGPLTFGNGVSYSDGNTPMGGGVSVGSSSNGKLILLSGQFTSTVQSSVGTTTGNIAQAISWDGTDTPWCNADKMFLQSGQFTSTVKESVTPNMDFLFGINTNKLSVG